MFVNGMMLKGSAKRLGRFPMPCQEILVLLAKIIHGRSVLDTASHECLLMQFWTEEFGLQLLDGFPRPILESRPALKALPY